MYSEVEPGVLVIDGASDNESQAYQIIAILDTSIKKCIIKNVYCESIMAHNAIEEIEFYGEFDDTLCDLTNASLIYTQNSSIIADCSKSYFEKFPNLKKFVSNKYIFNI